LVKAEPSPKSSKTKKPLNRDIYLKQKSAPLLWRIFERKSGTGVLRSVYMAPSPTIAKTLGTGFAARSVHAKPCFDCLLPVKALSGGVSLRSTFALDSPEQTRRRYEMKAACLRRSMAEA
jgi:hypothetical protein